VKVLKAIAPIDEKSIVRGQFRGYQAESGVATGSRTETFAALKLQVDTWRWQGVPFYIRAGKQLPVTSTEILVRLRRPPDIYQASGLEQNHIRLRISPDVEIAMGMMVLKAEKDIEGQPVEMVANHHPEANEMDAYERVLGEAIAGDTTLFAREDYVEEAWRIVDPVLRADTPVYEYDPGTWGPLQSSQLILPRGGWHSPVLTAPPQPAERRAA
jgi:glucose-6-phosphate 1-dehydrogenase